jgi:hypothetical protein
VPTNSDQDPTAVVVGAWGETAEGKQNASARKRMSKSGFDDVLESARVSFFNGYLSSRVVANIITESGN